MNIIITVDSEALQAKYNGRADALRRALVSKITRLSIEVQTAVKRDKLTGQVLHVRSDILRTSINREVSEQQDGVFATVGTPIGYGIGWENGWTRKLGAGARGGPKSLKGAALASYYARHPSGSRHEQRPFLRPTLQEFKPRIVSEIRAAVLSVLK